MNCNCKKGTFRIVTIPAFVLLLAGSLTTGYPENGVVFLIALFFGFCAIFVP